MPAVRLEALRKYHDHFAANLTFPFEGRLADPIGPHRDTRSPLHVIRLLDVDSYEPEEMSGLICKAERNGERIELPLDRIDVPDDSPNRQMLEDYRYWMRSFEGPRHPESCPRVPKTARAGRKTVRRRRTTVPGRPETHRPARFRSVAQRWKDTAAAHPRVSFGGCRTAARWYVGAEVVPVSPDARPVE